MSPIFIVKYFSNPNSKPRIVAFTHSKEKAMEICSLPETRKAGKWFYGWTEFPPVKPSRAGYPSVGDLLKAIYASRSV